MKRNKNAYDSFKFIENFVVGVLIRIYFFLRYSLDLSYIWFYKELEKPDQERWESRNSPILNNLILLSLFYFIFSGKLIVLKTFNDGLVGLQFDFVFIPLFLFLLDSILSVIGVFIIDFETDYKVLDKYKGYTYPQVLKELFLVTSHVNFRYNMKFLLLTILIYFFHNNIFDELYLYLLFFSGKIFTFASFTLTTIKLRGYTLTYYFWFIMFIMLIVVAFYYFSYHQFGKIPNYQEIRAYFNEVVYRIESRK